MPLNHINDERGEMKPLIHAQNSVEKYGGKIEDYLKIHEWFDETKAWVADHRHRAFRHHSQGIFVAEQVFGSIFTNSDDKPVSTRDIGEDHVFEDLGFIPTAQDYIRSMNLQPWMGGSVKGSTIKSAKDHEYCDGSSLPRPQFTPKTDEITAEKAPGIDIIPREKYVFPPLDLTNFRHFHTD